MARIKSKKYVGVYYEELATGDKSYYITYKLNGIKKWDKVGLDSEGINQEYCNNKRIQILNHIRLGEQPKDVIKKNKRINKTSFETIWFHYKDNKAMSERSRKELLGSWNKYLSSYFKDTVTIEKLKKFRNDKKDVLAPKTIDMRLSQICTAFNYWNLKNPNDIQENVVNQIRLQDKTDLTTREIKARDIKRERYLTIEEVKLLKEEIKDKHEDLILFTAIALSTGARLASILSIQKKDIKGRKVILINHKTGGGAYMGFFNDEVIELLKPRIAKLKPNDTIFTLERRQLQRRLQWIIDKLFNKGLDTKDAANRVVIHTLRHTFASRLVENGVPLVKVQKLLDHKDISTTMRYSHLAPDAGLEDVVNMWS